MRTRARRRRHEYTPEQELAREDLHRAETWLKIVVHGIAEALTEERYCGEGLRRIIDHVNSDLVSAVTDLENAEKSHALAFERSPARAVAIENPPRSRKSQPSPKARAKKKA